MIEQTEGIYKKVFMLLSNSNLKGIGYILNWWKTEEFSKTQSLLSRQVITRSLKSVSIFLQIYKLLILFLNSYKNKLKETNNQM